MWSFNVQCYDVRLARRAAVGAVGSGLQETDGDEGDV